MFFKLLHSIEQQSLALRQGSWRFDLCSCNRLGGRTVLAVIVRKRANRTSTTQTQSDQLTGTSLFHSKIRIPLS
jgi:hypothetical protein